MPNININRRVVHNLTSLGASEIGNIFDIQTNLLSDLSDFTISQDGTTSITLNSGYIKLTGTPAASLFTLDNYIRYNGYVTGLENWTYTVDYIIKSYTNANEGCLSGWMNDSSVGTFRSDWFIHFRNSSLATSTGEGYRYFNGTTTLTPFTFDSNPMTAAVTPAIDNEYRMVIEKTTSSTGSTFTLTIYNLTLGTSQSGTLNYSHASSSGQLDMSSSKFFLGHTGGTWWVSRLKLDTTEKKNVDYIVIGDSMTCGYEASVKSNSWFELVKSNNPNLTFTKTACQGDGPDTAVNKQSEIELINAKKAIIMIHSNQIVQEGLVPAQNSYNSLVTLIINSGIGASNIVHINCPPRAGNANIPLFNDWLDTNHGSSGTIIDVNTPFNDGSDNFDVAYSDDTVHPNDDGHLVIANLVNALI